MITHHAALVYTMVLVSAADNNMPDAELQSIGDMVMHLPVFRDFDRSKLTQITGDCAKLLQDKQGLEKALDAIKEGLPEKLRETAYALGCEVAAWREFPDHFAYAPAHIDELARWAQSHSADTLVCTHKDLVKLDRSEIEGTPLRAIRIGLEFLRGQDGLEASLDKLMLDRR
jgi:tetraacyldisaccharide-1-P 4'-kinase